tara:strand:+ start:711 stop:1475 length:765 start_codon:yes stop_codon:yes gene_type:complete
MKKTLEGKEIAIVAMGGSFSDYVLHRINSKTFDEVWGINSIGAVLHVDRTFMMDPAERFLDDVKAGLQTGVARDFLLDMPNKGPIYSCALDERVPEIIEYPLEDVINDVSFCYFNNTVAYALAFAIYSKVSKLYLYGIDFSYKQNLHFGEAGRSCVEFWCAVALSRGIFVEVAPRSGLLDTNVPEDEKLYGYHRLEDPLVQRMVDNQLIVSKKSKISEYLEEEGLSAPEPLDGRTPVLVGRHDIPNVSYEEKDD